MAERRMFAKSVVLSDSFLDLPASARCLYFTLGVYADDDGFVNAPNSLIRMTGACPDDLRLLLAKEYLLQFDSGVLAIKHWRVHNCIKKDRYHPTQCQQERKKLLLNQQNIYEWLPPDWNQDGSILEPEVRLGEDRLDEDSSGEVREGQVSSGEVRERFTPPTPAQIQDYCLKEKITINTDRFYDFYCSNGWMVGRNPMCNWQASVRRWASDEKERQKPGAICGSGELGQAELESIQRVLREDFDAGAPGDLVD